MKKLSIYAMLASSIISIIYLIKLQWFIETDIEFWRATALAALSEVGLWCFYWYARDYELIRAQEEHQKIAQKHMQNAIQRLCEEINQQNPE